MGIVIALLMITIMIIIHELGHFIFAKLFGVRVDEFSIGFGPALLTFGKKTKFRINAILFGGYVKVAGEEDIEADSDDPELLFNKKGWQKFLIAFAGPLFSILFGYAIAFFIVSHYGFPEVKVESVMKGYPADIAGIQEGDVLVKVNNKYIFDTNNIVEKVVKGERIELLIERNGEKLKVELSPTLEATKIGIYLKVNENKDFKNLEQSVVEEVNTLPPNRITELLSKLEKDDILILKTDKGIIKGKLSNYYVYPQRYIMGVYFATLEPNVNKDVEPFKKGDRILRVEDIQVNKGLDLSLVLERLSLEENVIYIEVFENRIEEVITPLSKKLINVVVERDGKKLNLSIDKNKLIKIFSSAAFFKEAFETRKPKGFIQSIVLSIDWVNYMLKKMVQGIVYLFSGRISPKEALGPVGITAVMGQAAEAGLKYLLSFVMIITLNLGIINLIPLPALDGGRIIFALYEMITGKRPDQKIEVLVHSIGFILLMALAAYITFFDIMRFVR